MFESTQINYVVVNLNFASWITVINLTLGIQFLGDFPS